MLSATDCVSSIMVLLVLARSSRNVAAICHRSSSVAPIAAFGTTTLKNRLFPHRKTLLLSSSSSQSSPQLSSSSSPLPNTNDNDSSSVATSTRDSSDEEFIPWRNIHYQEPETFLSELKSKKKKQTHTRFRQHVNPLARKYQQPTALSPNWPTDVFDDLRLPLYMDIGCGKGRFLRDLAGNSTESVGAMNYLGLEIRPSVVEYAQERIAKRGLTGKLDFVGCNANIDLERLLSHYQRAGGGPVETVSIQFPDPHFKKQHAKRRVVKEELVLTLAKFMPEASKVFLQSDVQPVLDDMRATFREYSMYFDDEIESTDEYMPTNPIGVPTERETSVLDKDLPVFRTVLRRTAKPLEDNTVTSEQ